MKKKVFLSCILTLVAIGAVACNFFSKGGNIRHVKTSITSTEHHSEEDIKTCMNIVKEHFNENFEGCTLTDLWYDDEVSLKSEDGWKKQYDGEEGIVLLSNFDVDSSGGDGSLNPNETYTHWNWILVKNSDGYWILETWGY